MNHQEDSFTIGRLSTGDLVAYCKSIREPIPLDQARKRLLDKIVSAESALEKFDEDVVTLLVSGETQQRNDLSIDDRQWAEQLQKAMQFSLALVLPLIQKAKNAGQEIKLHDVNVAERISDSFATITAALEQSLPQQSIRNGSDQLLISFNKSLDDASFRWCGEAQRNEPIRLLSLIRDRLSLVGGFKEPQLSLLARYTLQGLKEGWLTLPHFTQPQNGRESRELRLTWKLEDSI